MTILQHRPKTAPTEVFIEIFRRRCALQARDLTDHNVQGMYEESLPLPKEVLAEDGSNVNPGVREAIEPLRGLGFKIGSTTGYTRELMDVVVPIAARGGYSPDVIACSDEVHAGRPAP